MYVYVYGCAVYVYWCAVYVYVCMYTWMHARPFFPTSGHATLEYSPFCSDGTFEKMPAALTHPKTKYKKSIKKWSVDKSMSIPNPTELPKSEDKNFT